MKARQSHFALLAATLLLAGLAHAQAFSSGSTGSDGALNYPTAGTYSFNPATTNPVLDPSGDNIFNFTTINIAAGVTLTLTNSNLRGKPVVWLATGNVTIAGTLVLDGESGPGLANAGANWFTLRTPTQPGPGGYAGGVGARPGNAEAPGLGPGGGPVQTNANCGYGGSAAFSTLPSASYQGAPVASTYGNIQTVPLLGGSGGSGGCLQVGATAPDAAGGTGGAGGGAIRIVSTTSISVTGGISSQGGGGGQGRDGGYPGGAGSGGTINLIAPTVTGTGALNVYGGGIYAITSYGIASGGYILINATTNTFTGNTYGGITTLRPLIAPPLPTLTAAPTVTIVSVNSVPVPQPPQGLFATPDVTINTPNAVVINISAVGVPVGTVVTLDIVSELAADQVISCNPLAGTITSSTATCSATFPTSISAIQASVIW